MNVRRALLAGVVLIGLTASLAYRGRTTALHPFNERHVTVATIDKARADAQRNRKFLMVEFGANWCSDCRELADSMKQPAIQSRLTNDFVILNVDVGEFNRNLDIAKSLGIKADDGIPVAAFFAPTGGTPVIKRGNDPILAFLQSPHP